MNDVFEKASLLGEAIQQSEEFRAMRAAEEVVMTDAEASEIMQSLMLHKTMVEDMLTEDDPDQEVLSEHSEAMDALQETLGEMDIVQRMSEARAAFAGMMQQVNQVLRFMVTGEMDDEAGCGGNCGSCGSDCAAKRMQ